VGVIMEVLRKVVTASARTDGRGHWPASGATARPDVRRSANRDEGRRADGLTTAERQELGRLRRENRQLRIEREILSKSFVRPLRTSLSTTLTPTTCRNKYTTCSRRDNPLR
jgi:hypothetical protein